MYCRDFTKKMDNSLLVVRDINHRNIVVDK